VRRSRRQSKGIGGILGVVFSLDVLRRFADLVYRRINGGHCYLSLTRTK